MFFSWLREGLQTPMYDEGSDSGQILSDWHKTSLAKNRAANVSLLKLFCCNCLSILRRVTSSPLNCFSTSHGFSTSMANTWSSGTQMRRFSSLCVLPFPIRFTPMLPRRLDLLCSIQHHQFPLFPRLLRNSIISIIAHWQNGRSSHTSISKYWNKKM